MDHNHIVEAGDFDRYAPTRDSQAVIPELIYWLVRESCPNLSACRIPYGDSVNQPGWDGSVETDTGFHEFVPEGRSFWEIGTNSNPQKKATTEFKKRTSATQESIRKDSYFIFVTPRSVAAGGWNEPSQRRWVEKRKKAGWKSIRIIDGIKLADWLRYFPSIGMWMATKIPITPKLGGLSTAMAHWDLLLSERAVGDPPLPAKLFTTGRDGACRALLELFEGKTQSLMIFAESRHDVDDFVSAYIAGLEPDLSRTFSNRCLFVSDEQAWRSIVATRSPQILVADIKLGLDTEEGAPLKTLAHSKGHRVVIPLCGAWSGSSPEILRLRSPTQSQIETVLIEAGYAEIRARELGRIGSGRISAILRSIRGYGSLPPYATWENATLLAQAGLLGEWDGSNPNDRAALELFLGKGYGEWIGNLRSDSLRSDSPLFQINEKWRVVARGETWDSLGNRITNDDVDRFAKASITVLSERDPSFDLSKDHRFAASIHGKVLLHSARLRKGLAETLALMGSRPNALSSCSDGKAEWTVRAVVRQLLRDSAWDRWASLDRLMPLLAEASPDEFLDAVEAALVDLKSTPFHRIFAEEGGGGSMGWNYMTGLLWALESLAWSPAYLSRVSVVLADLASIDPGGNWSNRPANSLIDIFLPWHVQTTADFEKRKAAIEALLREQPTVGWKLLLGLLPHNHGSTMGSHRPTWREFIPRDWSPSVLNSEYWKQIVDYADIAVRQVRNDYRRIDELISRLPDLPPAAHQGLLAFLESDPILFSPESERVNLWESLETLVRRHRKYSDAAWALPTHVVDRIAKTAEALAPTGTEFRYHHLFDARDIDLFDEKGDYQKQRESLSEVRQSAVNEMLREGGLEMVLRLAAKVSAPQEIGGALGAIADDSVEGALLPVFLTLEDEVSQRLVASFVWARFWRRKLDWVDSVLSREITNEQKARFLTLLPFQASIWERVASHLQGDLAALYWTNVRVDPYASEGDATAAVEMLLKFGRAGAAVMCVARTIDQTTQFNEVLAIRALLEVLNSERGIRELDNYRTVELIKRLQMSPSADKDALFKIEWNFLPWLDRFSTGSPVTLERRLASDPAFFAEAIGLVYRSKAAPNCEEEPDEKKKFLAKNAYKLLTEWRLCPGVREDGSFSSQDFNSWITDARKLTEASGHGAIAQVQIGHVLTCAPCDPGGLWIHTTVAATLNLRDTGDMRSGFTTQLFNDRGVHGFTHGKEERQIAQRNRERADQLDAKGFTRFATAMREFAEGYERDAERESKRDPFEE